MKYPKDLSGARAGAVLITAGSLAWTAYGIKDLLGWAGAPVIIAVESLYLALHYAEIKGVGGPKARKAIWILGWVASLALGAFLCVHAAKEWGALAAIPAPIPPLAAKLLWWTDEQIRRRDSTEPTPEMVAERARAVREAEHIVRMTETDIRMKAAQEIARLKALGEVAMARTDVVFNIEVDRIHKEEELRIQKPLASFTPSEERAELTSGTSEVATLEPVGAKVQFGFSPALSLNEPPTGRPERIKEIKEIIATRGGGKDAFPISEIKDRYGVSQSTAYELRGEALK